MMLMLMAVVVVVVIVGRNHIGIRRRTRCGVRGIIIIQGLGGTLMCLA